MFTLSLSSCSTSSSALNNVVFIPPASNVKPEIIEPKIEFVSEDTHDKGKSILEAPPKFAKKKTKQNNYHFTKVDEANQTIEVLRFKNNFLSKKTKKLNIELF